MSNSYAKALKTIGIVVLFLGFVGTLILACSSRDINWTILLVGAFFTIVDGCVFLGFAEIINLLDKINKKTELWDPTEKAAQSQQKTSLDTRSAKEILLDKKRTNK